MKNERKLHTIQLQEDHSLKKINTDNISVKFAYNIKQLYIQKDKVMGIKIKRYELNFDEQFLQL